MKIGFIGLGAMGQAMALNLQRAGLELTVYDRNAGVLRQVIEHGAVPAQSIGDVARSSDIVFTCLPGPKEVEEVALSSDRCLLQTMNAGSVWIDFTTNSPADIQRLHKKFKARHIELLDAPISGGPAGASAARLALWVGGDRQIFQRYEKLLGIVGNNVLYLGSSGSGCIAKLVHNCASFSAQNAIVEAFTLGVKAGLDPKQLFTALRQGSTGQRRTFDRLAEHFLPNSYEPAAFALKLAYKDLNLTLDLARTYELSMPMAALTMESMSEGLSRGWADRDARIALSLYQEKAGIAFEVPKETLRILMEETG